MTLAILTILGALAPVLGFWWLRWLKNAPIREQARKRAEIAKAVVDGNADYVNRELDKLLPP